MDYCPEAADGFAKEIRTATGVFSYLCRAVSASTLFPIPLYSCAPSEILVISAFIVMESPPSAHPRSTHQDRFRITPLCCTELCSSMPHVSFGEPLLRLTYEASSAGAFFLVALDSMESIETERLETVSAGDQSSLKSERQMCPLLYICVCTGGVPTNVTSGAAIGCKHTPQAVDKAHDVPPMGCTQVSTKIPVQAKGRAGTRKRRGCWAKRTHVVVSENKLKCEALTVVESSRGAAQVDKPASHVLRLQQADAVRRLALQLPDFLGQPPRPRHRCHSRWSQQHSRRAQHGAQAWRGAGPGLPACLGYSATTVGL
jgi:hypothetical protein